MLQADLLSGLDGVRHGFFTREGGVSTGFHASLNCAYNVADSPENVRTNRARAMARLGCSGDQLVSLRQVHSARAVVIDEPLGEPIEADAMACRVPGLALGVLSADCAPVLLCDPVARVIGAAHAGWRGALTGVVEQAVQAMVSLGAAAPQIIGVIGPCIDQASYEVGGELRDELLVQTSDNQVFFQPSRRAGHYMFDLGGYLMSRLKMTGIGQAANMSCDTYTDHERFFSYRRATHQDESNYGCQLSAIVMGG